MSQEDKQPEPQQKPTPEGDKPAPPTEASKAGLKYVFKIASADPKRNSIDFEDVADK